MHLARPPTASAGVSSDTMSSEGVTVANWYFGCERMAFDSHLGTPELKKLVIGGKVVCTAFPRLKTYVVDFAIS